MNLNFNPYMAMPMNQQDQFLSPLAMYSPMAMPSPKPMMAEEPKKVERAMASLDVQSVPLPPPQKGPMAYSFNNQSQLEKSIEDETLEKFRDLMRQREGGIKGMQEQANQLRQKNADMGMVQKMDLSPLAGLVDNWTGSNLSAQYKAPQDYQKNEEVIRKLEDAMKREEGNLTGDQLSYLRLQQGNAQNKIMAEAARDARFAQSQDLKKEDNIRKDINNIADDYKNTQGQLSMAENMVRSGDTRQVGMIIASIARNVGEQKGALSDGDVARSLPPDIATNVGQLEAYLNRNAQISPQLQSALLNLINGARTKSQGIYNESLNRRKAQYSAGAYSNLMAPGNVGEVIFSEAMRGTAPPPQAPAPSQASAGAQGFMSPQDWLKQKRGAK